MSAVVVCYVSTRRRAFHAPGYCDTLRALIVADKARAESRGLPWVVDRHQAFMLAVCELPNGPERDLAFELDRTGDFADDFAALMSTVDARRLRDLAQGELEVAAAWLEDGKPDLHEAHVQEATRIEVLARQAEGSISSLLAGTALLMAETWQGDVDSLLTAARQVLSE